RVSSTYKQRRHAAGHSGLRQHSARRLPHLFGHADTRRQVFHWNHTHRRGQPRQRRRNTGRRHRHFLPHGGGGEDRILRDHVFGSAVKILTNGRQKTTSRGQQRKPARTCGTDLEAAIGSG